MLLMLYSQQKDPDRLGYLKGKDSIIVLLSKSSDGDTIGLNSAAFKVIEEMKPYASRNWI